jgi:hypothetical protein
MISKHVDRPDDERTRVGSRADADRDDARRTAEREARDAHERRLASGGDAPRAPDGIEQGDGASQR